MNVPFAVLSVDSIFHGNIDQEIDLAAESKLCTLRTGRQEKTLLTMMRRLLWSFLVLSLVLLDQTEGWRRRRRRRCPRTNCAVSSWTSWSTCTRSCGGGTQYRTRRVTRAASCGGSCPYGLRETQNCKIRNCPGRECQ